MDVLSLFVFRPWFDSREAAAPGRAAFDAMVGSRVGVTPAPAADDWTRDRHRFWGGWRELSSATIIAGVGSVLFTIGWYVTFYPPGHAPGPWALLVLAASFAALFGHTLWAANRYSVDLFREQRGEIPHSSLPTVRLLGPFVVLLILWLAIALVRLT